VAHVKILHNPAIKQTN